MEYSLNGVNNSEVLKFLAESPSETTHAIHLFDLFDGDLTQNILLQLKV